MAMKGTSSNSDASQRASGRCKEAWLRFGEYLPELPPEQGDVSSVDAAG